MGVGGGGERLRVIKDSYMHVYACFAIKLKDAILFSLERYRKRGGRGIFP